MELKRKHIVITGGTSGIGLEMVNHLVGENDVSVLARASDKLERAKRKLGTINFIETDLSDLQSVEQAADQFVQQGKNIDVLINNAAQQSTPTFLDQAFRYEMIKREIDVNFTSICCLIHLLLPLILKDSPSVILNINSGLAISPKRTSAIYCATKGALNTFSQSLRYQLEETNISVKQAFLPLVDTDMTAGRGKGKLSPQEAAKEILRGLQHASGDFDIGKVKLLRIIHRFAPGIAAKIMKAS